MNIDPYKFLKRTIKDVRKIPQELNDAQYMLISNDSIVTFDGYDNNTVIVPECFLLMNKEEVTEWIDVYPNRSYKLFEIKPLTVKRSVTIEF